MGLPAEKLLPPSAGKAGRPKGRGARKPEHTPLEVVAASSKLPPAPEEDYDALYKGLFSDSPLKSEKAKHVLVTQACTLHRQTLSMRRLVEAGLATGEEHRALSGIASNLRRVIEALGLTSTEDKELDL